MDLADPQEVQTSGEPTKKTQIIAIYGKGGIGKSHSPLPIFQPYHGRAMGKRVLLIGCDPKSDTTSLLVWRQSLPNDHRNLDAQKEIGGRGGENWGCLL